MDSFRRDRLVFDVRDSGPADGVPVVCLHGFPQDGSAFDAVAAPLAAGGARVLVPDQRGYSPGARPRDVRAYAPAEVAADVLALLDAAGLPSAHVVGHDWGGAVGWLLAYRHPARVRSLTALSTPHPQALWRALPRSSQALRSGYMAFFQVPRLPEAVQLAADGACLRAWLRSSGLPPDAVERYVARMREPGALSAALAWYRALPLTRGWACGRVRVPTTLLWGRRDPAFASAGPRATAGYVQGPYTEQVLEAGHWLPETHSLHVTAAVREHLARAER